MMSTAPSRVTSPTSATTLLVPTSSATRTASISTAPLPIRRPIRVLPMRATGAVGRWRAGWVPLGRGVSTRQVRVAGTQCVPGRHERHVDATDRPSPVASKPARHWTWASMALVGRSSGV